MQKLTLKDELKIELNDCYTPHYLSRKDDSNQYEYLTSFKGYQMLVALYQGTDSHIGQRCAYYLMDNDELTMKFHMKSSEGGFMSAVLNGDVAGAINRGSQDYREILCDAIKERRLEL